MKKVSCPNFIGKRITNHYQIQTQCKFKQGFELEKKQRILTKAVLVAMLYMSKPQITYYNTKPFNFMYCLLEFENSTHS